MIIDISDLNDNEPRTPYEVMIDESYWTLSQNFPDIERDEIAVRKSFQRRVFEIAEYDYGILDAPQLLSLLSDYETLLYPMVDQEGIQLQTSAQILADDIITEHGLESATQCMIEGFIASDNLRKHLAGEGEIDAQLRIGQGMISVLGQALDDKDRFSELAITNSADFLKDYLNDPAACSDPQWRLRLEVLATAGDTVKKPQAIRKAPIVDLAQARRSLKVPKP